MTTLTFADRLFFAPTRASRLWARQSAKSRAARARLLRRCCFAPSAGMGALMLVGAGEVSVLTAGDQSRAARIESFAALLKGAPSGRFA